jgi:hypothetical protein
MKGWMATSKEPKDYYFIDVDLPTRKIAAWGETRHATHTGATDDPLVHRVFLTRGQFNKLRKHLKRQEGCPDAGGQSRSR